MAANFQNMGGAGQMMPQQMQQQQQQQRPQQRPPQNGGASAQIQQLIFQTLQSQPGPISGWQSSVLLQERMGLVFNIIGNLRLASQHQPNPPTLQKMCEIGIKFEKDIFEKSPDKAHYKLEVQNKLNQLLERRNQNQASLQQSINAQAQAQAQAQQQAQSQQMMMNQNNGMQGQVPRSMPQQSQQPQQGFHHLQHQMQASPLPGQQMAMGMSNQGMPPNMTQNQQQQFQMAMQQQQSQQSQQQQNVPARPPNGQEKPSNEDLARINELGARLMAEASEEEKNNIRMNLQQRMDPQTHQQYLSRNVDPLTLYYRNQALTRLRQDRLSRAAQAQAQAQVQAQFSNSQQPQNMPIAAPAMQQQRSMQPSPMNGQQPPVSVSGGNPDFGSFVGGMENIIGQQQQAGVMAQEAGQMVVPVSGTQRNATPQPGGMSGQPMNVMDQRSLSNNPNASRQQQQQMINAQQAQQQRLQHAALQQSQKQQSQAQIRANAQAQAQQIALHGQPGGMGPGPVPPQQSPAMNTLNTPLRTPSQQMNHAEPLQGNPNAQFGQPLDPRFSNQANQRQLGGPNGSALAASMFASIPQDQQQRLAQLPAEKLNEVVNRWHEQRQQQQAAAQAGQPGRPPMQMPGNNQVRPGQPIPQPGQFNPQSAVNQFMMANQAGQRTPQNMAALTQQQQMLLQQQMAKVQQQQQQQRPPVQIPNDQRLFMQLDGLDFPTGILNHPTMPRQIPPELKKWGQVKQWAMQSQLGPEVIENIKNLQKMHYQNIMRQRNQHQQNQIGAAPGGPQGTQGQVPMVPPGMAAPVAPMGQNPMQVANGINIVGPGQPRMPTQEEIQQARHHPTGKMAGATDDQIRAFLMRMQANQMTPQQQQLRQNQLMQMQMQMANHAQINAQQARPNPQGQQNANAMGQNQPMQVQKQQPKQQAPPESTPVSGRATRPPTGGRTAAQNSSPAQPAKNLKRGPSNDDVVEVPNPNIQQPQRPPTQQPQGQAQTPQQPRLANLPNMTPQQLATLDPEARKRYEQARAAQQAIPPELMAKLKGIMQEENQRGAREPLHDVQMDNDMKVAVARSLRELIPPLKVVGQAMAKWYQITHDDSRARIFFRTRQRLWKQFRDQENMTLLKDTFSILPAEIEQGRGMLRTMIKELSDRYPDMFKKSGGAQTANSQPAPAPIVQPTPASSVPLNAANLQQQQQQLNKMHQRSGSRGGGHTPAAPTTAQPPPFQFGALSPHGQPAYIGKAGLTQDNLHIPARKKQKPNTTSAPGQTTPGSNASPLVKKATSPEMTKQAPVQHHVQQRPPLACPESECERYNVGFEKEEDLKRHTQEEHVKPLENPLNFVLESLTNVLGLDAQGKQKNTGTSEPAAASTAIKMAPSTSKQGQTPNMKAGATPVGAASTPMNRQGSTVDNKSSGQSKTKPDLTKDSSSKTQNDPNMQQSDAQAPEIIVDPWVNATIDPHELFTAFQSFESGAGGAISDMNVYRSITPNDTPESSKDSGVSEPNSDISDGVALDISLEVFDENWQPFGPSETETFFNTSNYNADMDGGMDLLTFDDDKPAVTLGSWDNFDTSVFDKPFVFDTSLYSMNAE